MSGDLDVALEVLEDKALVALQGMEYKSTALSAKVTVRCLMARL